MKTMKTPKLSRMAEIVAVRMDGEEGEEVSRTMDLSFSSEEPYQRFFGFEVLDHSAESVRMDFISGGSAPLLLDHDTGQQIGVVEMAEIGSDRRGQATVRFGRSALANEVFQDVQDGIRKNVSVGYSVNEMECEEKDREGVESFRVTDWTPLEVSIVSVPADASVGIGRDSEAEYETIVKKEKTMSEENQVPASPVKAEPAVDVAKLQHDAIATERSRVADIQSLASRHNKGDLGQEAIKNGATIDQFKGILLENMGETAPLSKPSDLNLDENEKREYSLLRAVRAKVTGDWKGAEFEKECSDEIAQRTGKTARGFFLPSDLDGWNKRDLTIGTATAGGNLKGTDHLGGSFIDALRDRLVVKQLGARVMSGLQGDVAIPALNAKTGAYWVAEDGAPTEGAPTFRQVTMAPKTVGAYVDMSRKLMIQSDPSVEGIVRSDILSQIAVAIDGVAIEGGGSNEPTGITQTSGIGSVAMGTNGLAPNWASVVQLVREVEIDNADVGSLAFLMNPQTKAKMANTARVASTDSQMILNQPWNDLYGYNMAVSNLVPSDLTKGSSSGVCSAMIFGNFNDLMIGEWGVVDVNIDDKSLSTTGQVRLVAFMDVDVAVRHAQSFSAVLDYLTT